MKVSIKTLNGVEVACVDVEATLQAGDLLALLLDQVGGTELLFGDIELTGSMSLSDFGLEEGSMLLGHHRGGVVGCLGRVPVHLEGSRGRCRLCSLLRRRPAGADCLPRRHREGVVGCLGRVPAYIQRSRGICRLCGLLSMRLKRFPCSAMVRWTECLTASGQCGAPSLAAKFRWTPTCKAEN